MAPKSLHVGSEDEGGHSRGPWPCGASVISLKRGLKEINHEADLYPRAFKQSLKELEMIEAMSQVVAWHAAIEMLRLNACRGVPATFFFVRKTIFRPSFEQNRVAWDQSEDVSREVHAACIQGSLPVLPAEG